jgi:hypothetical protein
MVRQEVVVPPGRTLREDLSRIAKCESVAAFHSARRVFVVIALQTKVGQMTVRHFAKYRSFGLSESVECGARHSIRNSG